MARQRQSEQDDRTGEYGGDEALEHERTAATPGAGPDETGATPAPGTTQAETKQDRDLASGEENPG